eukprot:362485-Prorocentrum_minimum.AAC.1
MPPTPPRRQFAELLWFAAALTRAVGPLCSCASSAARASSWLCCCFLRASAAIAAATRCASAAARCARRSRPESASDSSFSCSRRTRPWPGPPAPLAASVSWAAVTC